MRDSTLPLTYEDALLEIDRLKNKLHDTNKRWAKSVELRVIDNRSRASATNSQKKLNSAIGELILSGYDGPFMGPSVERLLKAYFELK